MTTWNSRSIQRCAPIVKMRIASWNEGASANVPQRFTDCYSMLCKHVGFDTHAEAFAYTAQAYYEILNCRTYLGTTLPSYKGDHGYYGDVATAWKEWAKSKKQSTIQKWY